MKKWLGFAGAKLKEYYGKKIIITSHRDNAHFFKEMETRGDKYYWAIKQADAIIRVNQETVSILKKYNKIIEFKFKKKYPIIR